MERLPIILTRVRVSVPNRRLRLQGDRGQHGQQMPAGKNWAVAKHWGSLNYTPLITWSQEQVVSRGLATGPWTTGANIGKLERQITLFELRAGGAQPRTLSTFVRLRRLPGQRTTGS